MKSRVSSLLCSESSDGPFQLICMVLLLRFKTTMSVRFCYVTSDPQNLVAKNNLLFFIMWVGHVAPLLASCGSLKWLVPCRAGWAVHHPHIGWLVMADGQAAQVLLHVVAHPPAGHTGFLTWGSWAGCEGVKAEAASPLRAEPQMSLPLHLIGQRRSETSQESRGAETDPAS